MGQDCGTWRAVQDPCGCSCVLAPLTGQASLSHSATVGRGRRPLEWVVACEGVWGRLCTQQHFKVAVTCVHALSATSFVI